MDQVNSSAEDRVRTDVDDAPIFPFPVGAASVAQPGALGAEALASPGGALPRVSRGFITLMVLAAAGANIALITPIAISLALRVQQLAPGNEENLGLITGLGAAGALVTAPLAGMLSDRTRSRLGRRSPWMIGGATLGVVALAVMASAPSVPLLALGWLLAQLGWGTAAGTFLFIQADRVPESQRGSVAGLMGFAAMIAPVAGSVIGAALVFSNYLVFLVPGGIGFLLVALFALTAARERRDALQPVEGRLQLGTVLSKYAFNPRRHPDFGWNWLGRFLFMFGVTLNTTFTIFFIAQKAGTDVAGVAGLIAVFSLGGVAAAAVGALGGGWVSDRIKRRKVLILVAGLIFAVSAVVIAFAPDLITVVIAGLGTQVAVGIFSSIDNAVLLDIIPDRETEAGRYSGISQIAISLAQSLAPLAASAILLIGVSGTDKNYTLLFIIAGAVTLLGALSISTRVKGSR